MNYFIFEKTVIDTHTRQHLPAFSSPKRYTNYLPKNHLPRHGLVSNLFRGSRKEGASLVSLVLRLDKELEKVVDTGQDPYLLRFWPSPLLSRVFVRGCPAVVTSRRHDVPLTRCSFYGLAT